MSKGQPSERRPEGAQSTDKSHVAFAVMGTCRRHTMKDALMLWITHEGVPSQTGLRLSAAGSKWTRTWRRGMRSGVGQSSGREEGGQGGGGALCDQEGALPVRFFFGGGGL